MAEAAPAAGGIGQPRLAHALFVAPYMLLLLVLLVAGLAGGGRLLGWEPGQRLLGVDAAGWALALLVAVHPWSVAWTRTATVPYALAFGCEAVLPATLLWLRVYRQGQPELFQMVP